MSQPISSLDSFSTTSRLDQPIDSDQFVTVRVKLSPTGETNASDTSSQQSDPHLADRQIEFTVRRLLQRKLNQGARRIVFDVDNGHVLMKGTVQSYYFKQLAQEAALRVNGVRSVMNQICVVMK